MACFFTGERVKLDFDALTIHSHPFTKHNVQQLYSEARRIIEEENQTIAQGQCCSIKIKRK